MRNLLRRGWVTLSIGLALAAGCIFIYSHDPHAGFPLTHKWRQTRLCKSYAERSGGHFTSGSFEPISIETFFSEHLGTCAQALTFSPNDYSIADLTNGYSENTWIFICGPQDLSTTSFSKPGATGKWLEEGPSIARPCEGLFKETVDRIR